MASVVAADVLIGKNLDLPPATAAATTAPLKIKCKMRDAGIEPATPCV
jgi:hypothetical protein